MFDLKNPAWLRRFFVMLGGLLFIGCGLTLFKLSLMGNDPHTAMAISVGNRVGISFSLILIIINAMWFVLEIALARNLIGIGTFCNWVLVGIFADLWSSIITGIVTIPDNFAGRLFIMLIGILVLTFSCALYQTADLGIAPYDSISMLMADRLPIPYFWCRIITDSFCAIVAVMLGGIVGLGTLICAFALGPFINFFSKTAARKLCGYESI